MKFRCPIKMSCPRGRGSFTLLELLVVVSILAGVVAAIGACLSAGIRAWEAAEVCGVVEGELAVGLEVLERDVANAGRFFDVSFRGSEKSLTLPSTGVFSFSEKGAESSARGPGTVRYWFDPQKRCLYRRCWPYPLPEPEGDRDAEAIIAGAGEVVFSYFESGSGGAWLREWSDPTNFPAAVKVAIRTEEGMGMLTRTMRVPMAIRAGAGTK